MKVPRDFSEDQAHSFQVWPNYDMIGVVVFIKVVIIPELQKKSATTIEFG